MVFPVRRALATLAAAWLLVGPAGSQPAAAAACDLYTDKTAVPAVVTLGEEVTITLTLDGRCPPQTSPLAADIVLALDRSASQRDNGTWEPTKSAAAAFLDQIDFVRHQVALLTFGAGLPLLRPDVEFHQRLSHDEAAVKAALAAIEAPPSVTWATNITAAIEAAQQELTGPRHRDEARPVLVLLSDGAHNAPGTEPPAAAAQRAKAAGTLIITIGLAVDDAAAATLRAIASRSDLYFPSPTATELAAILVEIAGRLVSGGITSVRVVDMLPPEVALVIDSVTPAPTSVSGNTITWQISTLAATGWTARYRIRPLVAGSYNANKLAYVDYLDADGTMASRPFPLPLLTVRPPQTPLPGRHHAHLPSLWLRSCRAPRAADVVLVMDTSSSMWGEKLTRARDAAREFVSLLTLPPCQVAVVAFHRTASLVQPLTSDRRALQDCLDSLPRDEGSRLDLGLATAVEELSGSRHRPDHVAAVILLTDGRQVGAPVETVYQAAAEARRRGIVVFTIGIGDDADAQLLLLTAGAPERYFAAASPAELARIYRAIAGDLPCVGSP